MKPGKTIITVTTTQGKKKDTCIVYVKEKTPTATAGIEYIEGLMQNAEYTVSGNTLIADEEGRIAIDDNWRESTVSIAKTNAEPKCNSDVQELYIQSKTAISITNFSSSVSLEYTQTDYDGTVKEPTISINGLVRDTDYMVSYSQNTNAGSAVVILRGHPTEVYLIQIQRIKR